MTAPQLGPTDAQISLMGHNIEMLIRTETRRRRRRTRVGLAVTALGAAVSISAASILVTPASPELQQSYFDCYTTADPSQYPVDKVVFDAADLPSGLPRAQFAIQNCALSYEVHRVLVPNPTPCLLPDLRVGVFPNEAGEEPAAFCATLGLPPVDD